MTRFLPLALISIFLALSAHAFLKGQWRWGVFWITLFAIEAVTLPYLLPIAITVIVRGHA